MRIPIKSKYTNEMVILNVDSHYGDSSQAITITATTLEGEPQFTATVSIVGELPAEGCVFLKGWSENEGIPEALVKAGVVELTGRKVRVGFSEAIEAKLII